MGRNNLMGELQKILNFRWPWCFSLILCKIKADQEVSASVDSYWVRTMSLGKLPGIKSLMSGSQGKRHFKSDLSVDMISPPLGDFRHTMHVGRGGDVFGDTSFLSNHGGAAGDDGDAESTGFFSRTLRHVRKTPNRPRCGSRDFSPPPPPISPIIKNAISLPQLNLDTTNGCLQRVLFPSSPSSPGDISYTYGIQSGFLTLPRPSRTDRQLQPSSNPYSPEIHRESLLDSGGFSLVRSDSLGSFTVDLGPSLLSEVFAVIDSPTCVLEANYICVGEEPEVSQSLIPKSMVITGSTMEVGMQKDSGSKESLGIEVWAQDTGSLEGPMPDVAVGHVATPEPSIEPARFQRAADVLARHYGGNGLLQRQQQPEDGGFQEHSCAAISSTGTQKRAPYAYPEDEDEIKV